MTNRFSLQHLKGDRSQLDLTEHYRSFAVPMVFIFGHYDRHFSSELAERYCNTIHAPCKRRIWFEQSGNNPPVEEGGRVTTVMTGDVLPLAEEGSQ